MNFDIITIFPNIFKEHLKTGLLGKAGQSGLLRINIHDLRCWTKDKHQKVDDRPYGGGLGMVMKIEPIFRAVAEIKKEKNSKVILFSPGGKKFNQKVAHQFLKTEQLIIICGRYEGVDERVAQYIADEEISIGNFVLMGGEVPAMTVIETVARLIPGVVGKESFLKERIKGQKGVEYPQFTRPALFKPVDILTLSKLDKLKLKGKKLSKASKLEWSVPAVLISGNHQEVTKWKRERERKI